MAGRSLPTAHVLRRVAIVAALCPLVGPAAAQSVSNTASLSFGAFLAGSGGTVVVSPAGFRSRTGGVLLIGQGAAAAASQFVVSGSAGAAYTLTLPANNLVMLADGNSHTMAVNAFVANPSGGTLPAGGTQIVYVGASLSVGSGQPAGDYTGSYSVTANYQ